MFCMCTSNDLYQEIIRVFDVWRDDELLPPLKKNHVIFTNEQNFNWVVQADRTIIGFNPITFALVKSRWCPNWPLTNDVHCIIVSPFAPNFLSFRFRSLGFHDKSPSVELNQLSNGQYITTQFPVNSSCLGVPRNRFQCSVTCSGKIETWLVSRRRNTWQKEVFVQGSLQVQEERRQAAVELGVIFTKEIVIRVITRAPNAVSSRVLLRAGICDELS
jgi:hypothetical protein